MTTTTSEAITMPTARREPPILNSVLISRRRKRSDSMNTSDAEANVARPRMTAPAMTKRWSVRIVSSSSSITSVGTTTWATSSAAW